MNKLCESCQYNGPYLSIVNPCESCPNNDFPITKTVTTTTTTDTKTLHFNTNTTGDVSITQLQSSLPTAEEYRERMEYLYNTLQQEWSEPKYICPKCGGGMCRYETIVYMSNPPQYEYKCNKCGNVEYQFG